MSSVSGRKKGSQTFGRLLLIVCFVFTRSDISPSGIPTFKAANKTTTVYEKLCIWQSALNRCHETNLSIYKFLSQNILTLLIFYSAQIRPDKKIYLFSVPVRPENCPPTSIFFF